jgi:hypothetical protein
MSNLVGRVRCRCEYRVCGGCEGVASPGRAKTTRRVGEKWFLGRLRGARADCEETCGSENETRLGAAGPPERAVASTVEV